MSVEKEQKQSYNRGSVYKLALCLALYWHDA